MAISHSATDLHSHLSQLPKSCPIRHLLPGFREVYAERPQPLLTTSLKVCCINCHLCKLEPRLPLDWERIISFLRLERVSI